MTSKRVTAYLRDELDSEQVVQFERDVQENEELAEELARQLLQQKGRLDLKAKLGEFEKQRTRTNSLRKRSVWLAAASLVFLVGFFIWQAIQSVSPQELYASYFEAAAPINVTRDVGSENAETLLGKAMLLYSRGEYYKAKSLFEELKTSSQTETAQFYLAICHLSDEEANYPLSIELLSTVVTLDGLYQRQAHWYRGLVYLQINKPEEAQKDFKVLANSGGYKSSESKQILKQL